MLQPHHTAIIVCVVVLLMGCQATPTPAPFTCPDPLGCVTIGPDEPINIGILQDQSGGFIATGLEQIRVIEFAVAERNYELLGHPIDLIIEDSGCSAAGGGNAALRLTSSTQIAGVLGTTCSGAAIGADEVLSPQNLVMISGVNAAPSLTSVDGETPGADWHPGYYRTVSNGVEQGRTAALFAFEELGVTRAATLNDGDAYPLGVSNAFSQAFIALGGEIVAQTQINKGDENMQPVLEAIVQSEAELLFLPVFEAEGSRIVRQSQAIDGFDDIDLFGAQALLVSSFIESVNSAGEGMYFVIPYAPRNPAHADFLTRYETINTAPLESPFYAYSYDSATLLLDTIEMVAIQGEDNRLYIGRQALRQALSATENYAGITGPLTCDQFGDCAHASSAVLRLDDASAGLEGLLNNIVYGTNATVGQ